MADTWLGSQTAGQAAQTGAGIVAAHAGLPETGRMRPTVPNPQIGPSCLLQPASYQAELATQARASILTEQADLAVMEHVQQTGLAAQTGADTAAALAGPAQAGITGLTALLQLVSPSVSCPGQLTSCRADLAAQTGAGTAAALAGPAQAGFTGLTASLQLVSPSTSCPSQLASYRAHLAAQVGASTAAAQTGPAQAGITGLTALLQLVSPSTSFLGQLTSCRADLAASRATALAGPAQAGITGLTALLQLVSPSIS